MISDILMSILSKFMPANLN